VTNRKPRRLHGRGAGHLRLGEAESGEQFLVNGRQQVAVSLGQLDFFHRKVGVEVSDVERRQLQRQQTNDHQRP